MKAPVIVGAKIFALTVVLVICFTVASVLSGVATATAEGEIAPVNPAASLAALFMVCFLETAVLSYFIVRSRWAGWKLVGAVFVVFYGLGTVVAQIDSIVYLPRHLPPGLIPRIFIMGAITSALFSPLAVLILGRMRQDLRPQEISLPRAMPPLEWTWRLAAIGVAYALVYFAFGYFVAWKNPSVQAYYGGTDAGGFVAQMAWIGATTPWMFPFQAVRGILFAVFALPAIRALPGRRWEVALATALLFTVWSGMLLLPNPYMPREIRMVHLVETALEDFLFGFLVGWLLSRRQ